MQDDSPKNAKFPFGIFLSVFIFVAALVFAISVIRTSLLTKSYAGTARIKVEYKSADDKQTRFVNRPLNSSLAKTEAEVINSETVMRKAIYDLELNIAWGKKYFNGETLKNLGDIGDS